MRISFEVSVKRTLAVLALCVVAVGALWLANMRGYSKGWDLGYKAGRFSVDPYADIAVPITPEKTQFIPDNITEEAWCAQHHNTGWAGHGESGSCDAKGDVWVVDDKPTRAPSKASSKREQRVPDTLPATFFDKLSDGTKRWYQPSDHLMTIPRLAQSPFQLFTTR